MDYRLKISLKRGDKFYSWNFHDPTRLKNIHKGSRVWIFFWDLGIVKGEPYVTGNLLHLITEGGIILKDIEGVAGWIYSPDEFLESIN